MPLQTQLKRTVITTALAALWASSSLAAPLEAELRDLIAIHPGIKSARLAAAATLDREAASRASYFPKVTLSGDTGKERIESRSFKSDTDPQDATRQLAGTSGPAESSTYSKVTREKLNLSIEQSIYNGGRRENGVEIARLDAEIQSLNLEAKTQEVLLEAISAYLQVGRYRMLIGLSKLNEETTQRQLDLESKRVAGGGGISVDVLQARTRLQIVRERRVFYEQGLRDAIANYEQVFGRAPVLDAIQDVQSLQSRMPSNIIVALEKALESNSQVRVANLQVERAARSIALEKSAFMPSLDFVVSNSRDLKANQTARRDETSALLKMNWVLFSGRDTSNRVLAAEKEREELQARQQLSSNKVREAVRINWNQLVNGAERLELLDSAAAISRDVMEDRKRLRDAGKESALSVLDAEVEYYGVLASKVNAMYDTRVGSYRLLQSMGELTPQNLGLDGKFTVPVQAMRVDLNQIATPGSKR
jgi:TolC family type I secretion outer membrane protein